MVDRVKIIKRFDEPLRFSVSALEKGARLYLSLVDSLADDVLFHVEFDKEAGEVSVKDRYAGVWSKPEKHEFAFKWQTIKGRLSLQDETFVLEVTDFRLRFPCKTLQRPILWNIYSDFRYVTLGDDEPVTAAPARRWRFFPDYALRVGIGPRLRVLGNPENLRPGLTALYLWNGNENALRTIVAGAHHLVDELLIIVHTAAMLRQSFFIGLQSTCFNIRTVLVDTLMIKSDGEPEKLSGALFINKVLSEARHRNVVLLDPETDTGQLADLVHRHRLRSRADDFLLLDEQEPHALQAFSLGRLTHFVEDDGRLQLPPEDLAYRHPVYAPAAAPRASLDWNIAETPIHDFPVTVREKRPIRIGRRGKLVILVISCRKNRHKQQAIRDTWAADAHMANIDLCFVEGHPERSEAILVEDRLLVPAPDTYEYLSHKIWHAVCAGARIFDADHYLKLDDDCLVNVQKLLEFAYEDHDYVGSDVNLGSRTAYDWHHTAVFNKQLADLIFEIDPYMTWFDGQGGYFLSRKAADIMVSTPLAAYQHMLEDYATGRLMSRHGMEATTLNSKFLSIRDMYIKSDRDYEHAVISDVAGVERIMEVYETVSRLNQQTVAAKGRWRFDFAKEAGK